MNMLGNFALKQTDNYQCYKLLLSRRYCTLQRVFSINEALISVPSYKRAMHFIALWEQPTHGPIYHLPPSFNSSENHWTVKKNQSIRCLQYLLTYKTTVPSNEKKVTWNRRTSIKNTVCFYRLQCYWFNICLEEW